MLLDVIHHTKLISIPWVMLGETKDVSDDRIGRERIYVKSVFGETDYRVLATNLRYTWFEFGNCTSITERASKCRMEIETKEQVMALIISLRSCFDQQGTCRFRIAEDGHLKIDYKETQGRFTALSWTFDCVLLETSVLGDNKSYLDGPTVLYKHFIFPLVLVTQSVGLDDKKEDEDNNDSDNDIIDHTWLNQLSLITEQVEKAGEQSTEVHVTDQSETSAEAKDSMMTSSSAHPKKLTDPDKELERRTQLELDLLRRKEKGKKKRRLF